MGFFFGSVRCFGVLEFMTDIIVFYGGVGVLGWVMVGVFRGSMFGLVFILVDMEFFL